jgi:hypothetical protein
MKNKNLLIGLGVVVVVYFLWKKNKDKNTSNTLSTLSEQEKTLLFEKASNYYKGGVAPPQDLLDRLEKGRNEATAKITELKLDAEFSTWLSNRPKVDYGNFPPPVSAPKRVEKPCKKWIQPACITTPCPPMCVEY